MHNKDWTLVFFTTLSQASIGITVCIAWLLLANDGHLTIETRFNLGNPVLLALLLVGFATSISFFHLGNPSNAPKSLNNLAGSWVSREILALGVYSISLVTALVVAWTDWNTEYLNCLQITSAVFGLIFLWTMTRIYNIPTIPPWNSWYTSLSFVLTALCLGLIATLFLNQVESVAIGDQLIERLAVFLTIVLSVELVSALFHQVQLAKMETGITDITFSQGTYYRVFLLRLSLIIIALLAASAMLISIDSFAVTGPDIWIYLLLAAGLAQELAGRLLFYSSYFRIGV